MKWSTEIKIPIAETHIQHRNKIMLLGSCFSSNMGYRLKDHGFSTLINPLGISYNPYSIAKTLSRIQAEKTYTEDELVYKNERWHHHDFHSDFSGNDKSDVLDHLNTQQQQTKNFLQKTSFLTVTLGTAWVYEYQGEIVNNCHKFPSERFTKRLLNADEIRSSLDMILEILPLHTHLITTVSPIRHLKDGGIENSHSKSRLVQAAIDFSQDHSRVSYFPSYEIMMDELRDYRFYERDLIHPNEVALDHIWSKFQRTYMTEETHQLNLCISKYKQSLKHRFFDPDSDASKKFKFNIQEMRSKLLKEHPYLDLD